MCGRYTLIRLADFTDMFPWVRQPEQEQTPRYNISPSQLCPIVRAERGGKPGLSLAKWGLIPSWQKGKPKLAPINARAENVNKSNLFRQPLHHRRCLVPTDGFFEWKGAKPPKQPYYVHLKDGKPFAFAGLWERWIPEKDAQPIETFTIITTEPNSLIKPLHNRMPVILDKASYAEWLDHKNKPEDVLDLLSPFISSKMEAFQVGTGVNRPANQGPGLIERQE